MSTTIDAEGRRLFGQHWGGVFARDTIPAISGAARAMIVNTDKSTGRGVHWLACLDVDGKRYFNDPLGYYGKEQRADLETLQPHPFAEDDNEQHPDQKDCGVRALVALVIGLRCGVQCFLDL